MTEYKITLDCGLLFVETNDGNTRQGPYKNEESAKRRIRDLKRKDKEQTEIVADMEATGMISGCSTGAVAIITPTAIVSDMARDDVPQSYIGLPITGQIEPLVAKLAMSSEYGKSKPFAVTPAAASMDNYVPLRKHAPNPNPSLRGSAVTRQVGCYPAISKHAYQR